MARPKQRKAQPTVRQNEAVRGATAPSVPKKVAPADIAAEADERPAPRQAPTGRQKLLFAISLIAFLIWMACLAAMVLFRSK